MRRALLIGALALLALVVGGSLVLRRLLDADAVRVALERQASDALGHRVTVATLDWAVFPRPRVALADVTIGEPAAVTLSRVEVTTGLRALLSRRIEAAGLVVSGSRIVLPLPIVLGTGSAAEAPVAGHSSDAPAGLTIASIDRIAFDDVELVAGVSSLRLDIESSLTGDRLEVSRFSLTSDRTSVTGRGELTSIRERRGVFSATADPLELDEVLGVLSGFSGATSTAGSGPAGGAGAAPVARSMDVRVDVHAPRGRMLGIDFANLQTTVALSPGGVTLEPLAAGLFEGTLSGQVHLDTTSEPSRLALSARAVGLNAAALVAFAGSPGVLTGRLDGEVALHGRGGQADAVFRSARGRGTVAVSDGTLPGLDLVGPVILAFGRPDASRPTDPSRAFSRLGGSFELADGVLRSSDLAMASRDVDLKGRGTLRVAGAVADVHADLVLSEALSAQAGRDLYRYARDGGRVVLPARVTGALASPSVSIDLKAAAARAARNELQDQARKALGRLRKP